MKNASVFVLLALGVAVALPRFKRQLDLPSGAEEIVGPIKGRFSCEGLGYGYYADIENDCKIFHVCHPTSRGIKKYSYMCGNRTIFLQLSLTCASVAEATEHCKFSKGMEYINERIGNKDSLFLTDADVVKAQDLLLG